MLSQPKPSHLKKATSLKMNGTLLLKWLVAFCVLDGVDASEFDAITSPSPAPPPLCGGLGSCNCPYDPSTGVSFPSVSPLTSKCCRHYDFPGDPGECGEPGEGDPGECCVFPPPPSPPEPVVEGSICNPTLPGACGNPPSGLTCVPSASEVIPTPPARCQRFAGCPSCTGRRVNSGGEYYFNPHGDYRYPRSMPPIFAGMARGGGASYVYDLNVTFRENAYLTDPTGTTNVTYYFELAGCTYDNITFGPGKEQPRPVQYNATGFPIDPPFCNDATGFRSGEEGKYMENFGKFVDNDEGKGTPFVPVPTSDSTPVSKIFEFLWCPDQDRFHVTVFKQGDPVSGCPYQFRSQASSPSPPESVVKGSICNPALPGACGSTSNPPSGLTCVCTRRSRSLLFAAVPDGVDNSDTSQCHCA